ncbi:class I SAM-dependent methyltransferase [Natronobiforma cellulositropha]|uniref:class I SAM-dependent methyltransferase n=1 Tax=Natronobiforma cellulositropha TaxID=1679076 RepID=UPI0021D61439|nr:class I SAM-dependent methyltransferase [Natronobiforma cellulositropha]
MESDSPYPDCFYNFEIELSDEQLAAFTESLLGTDAETVRRYRSALRSNDTFYGDLQSALERTEHRPTEVGETWRDLLYVIVRIVEPETVVETGVFDGLSSAYFLQALADNGRGTLISIDVEETELLPSDLESRETGWVVSETLREWWDLRIGDARAVLPTVAEEETVDVFLHDSCHDADHMRFEFSTVRPAMATDGVFLADNVEYNDAFAEFAAEYLHNTTSIVNAEKSLQRDGGTVENDKLGAGLVS